MKYLIDAGDPSSRVALACCACGARFLAVSREAALIRIAAHETMIHPHDHQARAALQKYRQRATRRKSRP